MSSGPMYSGLCFERGERRQFRRFCEVRSPTRLPEGKQCSAPRERARPGPLPGPGPPRSGNGWPAHVPIRIVSMLLQPPPQPLANPNCGAGGGAAFSGGRPFQPKAGAALRHS